MHQTGYKGYHKDEHSEVVALKVAKSDVTVYLILPKEDKDYLEFQTDENGIWNNDYLLSLLKRTHTNFVNVALEMPEFAFDFSVEMQGQNHPLVHAMDLDYLFGNYADFSAMGTEDSPESKIGLVKQSTRVEFDKNGIKAATATIIGGIERTSVGPRTPDVFMKLDRPFYFVIADNDFDQGFTGEPMTTTILFTGAVSQMESE